MNEATFVVMTDCCITIPSAPPRSSCRSTSMAMAMTLCGRRRSSINLFRKRTRDGEKESERMRENEQRMIDIVNSARQQCVAQSQYHVVFLLVIVLIFALCVSLTQYIHLRLIQRVRTRFREYSQFPMRVGQSVDVCILFVKFGVPLQRHNFKSSPRSFVDHRRHVYHMSAGDRHALDRRVVCLEQREVILQAAIEWHHRRVHARQRREIDAIAGTERGHADGHWWR